MSNWLRYWDAVVIFAIIVVCIALLAVGCGALVFWLAASFSPAMLACGAGSLVFLFLLFMFFRMLRG